VVKQKKNFQETTSEPEPIVIERAVSEDNTRTILGEIKNYEGVIGYILRNNSSAVIDLDDPNKVMDFAVLSSSAFEASERLSELFDLGEIKNMTVKGQNTETVHLSVGENNVSIFMEKNADAKKILGKMLSP
jgi:predicted regulator of Ras-like GTPase activity (Roadblock/LC7/MglB family)